MQIKTVELMISLVASGMDVPGVIFLTIVGSLINIAIWGYLSNSNGNSEERGLSSGCIVMIVIVTFIWVLIFGASF